MTPIYQRFMSKINAGGPEECWNWNASRDRKGYGRFMLGGINRRAHRVARMIVLGEVIPSGKMACHKCNNPTCVNPSHIYFGTAKDNAADVLAAGNNYMKNVTHCRQGHDYSNHSNRGINKIGRRYCKECHRTRARKRREKSRVNP